MSKIDGWISIHRRMQNNWVYEEKPYSMFQAWIDILFEVNHKKEKVVIKNTIMDCERGESLKSLDTWAERWGWSKSKVRRFFQLLESDTMVTLKSERITTRLSVANYDTYQSDRNTNETQVKRKPTPNNKDNKKNKEKKVFIAPTLQEVKDYFKEKGYKESVGITAWNYYDTGNWKDSKGNTVKNWKQKMIAVWMKDEHKISTELTGGDLERAQTMVYVR